MSLIHFKYLNEIDKGTIFSYSSQLPGLPATNIQNSIKSKVWQTESDFVVRQYNRYFLFRDTATSVEVMTVASGTYTGSGIASVLETGMNSTGLFSNHFCNYNSATQIFTIGRSSTSTGIFQIHPGSGFVDFTIYPLIGLEHDTFYDGAPEYTSASTFGNEHEIVVSFTSTQSVNTVIIDNHNWATGTVIQLRGTAYTASMFKGGWNDTASIGFSSTVVYNSSIISLEFTATSMKAMQIYWYDRSQRYSKIGRIYAGTYFEPQFRFSNDNHWRKKTIRRRSNQTMAYSGVTWVDRRDSVYEYEIGIDPLDPYYNNITKETYEDMVDYIGNWLPIWVSLSTSLNSQTIYGLLTEDTVYDRLENTPVLLPGTINIREQK